MKEWYVNSHSVKSIDSRRKMKNAVDYKIAIDEIIIDD